MSIQRLIGALFLAIGLTNMVMAADSRPDVAQIINKTEASAILGEPVKDPSQRSGDGTDGYYSKCNYYSVRSRQLQANDQRFATLNAVIIAFGIITVGPVAAPLAWVFDRFAQNSGRFRFVNDLCYVGSRIRGHYYL